MQILQHRNPDRKERVPRMRFILKLIIEDIMCMEAFGNKKDMPAVICPTCKIGFHSNKKKPRCPKCKREFTAKDVRK